MRHLAVKRNNHPALGAPPLLNQEGSLLPSSDEEGGRSERRGGAERLVSEVARTGGFAVPVSSVGGTSTIAHACVTWRLNETTTPALGAPPLLNQEGSSPSPDDEVWRASSFRTKYQFVLRPHFD